MFFPHALDHHQALFPVPVSFNFLIILTQNNRGNINTHLPCFLDLELCVRHKSFGVLVKDSQTP